MSILNDEQKAAAAKLLSERPRVLSGTRAILIESEATAWHGKVTLEMERLKVTTDAQVNEFCNIAGVAD